LPHWPLGIGQVPTVSNKRRWWAERPARDRALLFGLLDALPAAAVPLHGPMPQDTLRRHAVLLHREARRLVSNQSLRTQLRRLRHLVGLGRPGQAAGQES
jgi:hypothetical protein